MGHSSALLRQVLVSTGPVPLPQSLECISTGNPRLVESPGIKRTSSSKETPGEEFRTKNTSTHAFLHSQPPSMTLVNICQKVHQDYPPFLSKEGLNRGGKS